MSHATGRRCLIQDYLPYNLPEVNITHFLFELTDGQNYEFEFKQKAKAETSSFINFEFINIPLVFRNYNYIKSFDFNFPITTIPLKSLFFIYIFILNA